MPELANVLEFVDPSGDVLAVRLPESGEAVIPWGSQLVVREGQTALFFRDGKAMAAFEPGRHVLTTQSVPALTRLLSSAVFGGESPFKAEVVFVGRQLFRELRWGTPEPFYVPDPVLLQVPLRAHGRFAIRVAEPAVFVPKLVATRPLFRTRDLEDFLRSQYLVSALTDGVASLGKPFTELPRYYRELGLGVKSILAPEFAALGLELTDVSVNSVSTTEEVQAALTKNTQIASEAYAKARGTQLDLEARAAGAAALRDAGTSYRDVGLTEAAKTMAEAAATGDGAGGAVQTGLNLGMAMLVPQVMSNVLKGDAAATAGASSPPAEAVDPVARLKQLKELLDAGVLTAAEYDAKKAEWLKRL